MLQEFRTAPEGKRGEGVSICFQCKDALAIYHAAVARGSQAKNPFVGNHMWVTTMLDPDGYKLDFESPTDVPEETELGRARADYRIAAITPFVNSSVPALPPTSPVSAERSA